MSNVADRENNPKSPEDGEEDAHTIGPRKLYHRTGQDIEEAAAFDADPKALGKVSTPYPW